MVADAPLFILEPHRLAGGANAGSVVLIDLKIVLCKFCFGFEPVFGFVFFVIFKFRVAASETNVGDITIYFIVF